MVGTKANDVRLRLYITGIVIAMIILYVGPLIVNAHYNSIRSELLNNCVVQYSQLGFELCWSEARRNAAVPIWEYTLPLLPAAILLWLNWLLKPHLKLTAESFPTRTITTLLLLSFLCAVGGSFHPIWYVATLEFANMEARETLALSWTAFCWVLPPFLFQHLVGPSGSAPSLSKRRIAIALIPFAIVVASAIWLVRAALIDYGS